MKKTYSFFSALAMLLFMSAHTFAQDTILLVGAGAVITEYASDKDYFDSLTSWDYNVQ